MIVKMEPMNTINNKAARTYCTVEVRPMSKSAMDNYQMVVKIHRYDNVFCAHNAHDKAKIFLDEYVQVLKKMFFKQYKLLVMTVHGGISSYRKFIGQNRGYTERRERAQLGTI